MISRTLVSLASALLLAACSSTADHTVMERQLVPVRPPAVAAVPASRGSLFPAAMGASTGFRPLFEDRRARQVGDTLTVVLDERTAATKRNSASASRRSRVDGGVNSVNRLPVIGSLAGAGISAGTDKEFRGQGSSSSSNDFSGTITVTVVEVLANGNLVVTGEKRLAVGADEEVIRLSGVVNPADLSSNTVLSSFVAEARIEYRGRGLADDAQQPGVLMRALFKLWPF
jgi:flagellar L-ring protein FlgH